MHRKELYLEIELVQSKINHFDLLRHSTKQMCITLWLTVFSVALTLKFESLAVLSFFLPIPFWIMDSTYHSYQEGFTERVKAVQNYLRTSGNPSQSLDQGEFARPDMYGVHTGQIANHSGVTSFWNNFFKRKAIMFYGALCVASAIAILGFDVVQGWSRGFTFEIKPN